MSSLLANAVDVAAWHDVSERLVADR